MKLFPCWFFLGTFLISLLLIQVGSSSCTSALLKCNGSTYAGDLSLTYVQSAKEGSFLFGLNGTYALSLKEVNPYTFYYSDKPYRIAGSESVTDFIKDFSWNPEPYAVITIPDAKSDMDTLILQLSNPKYSPYSNTLDYTARIVKDYNGKAFADLKQDVDAKIPEDFQDVSIYLSSEGQNITCPPDRPYRCSDGRCVVNRVPCPPTG